MPEASFRPADFATIWMCKALESLHEGATAEQQDYIQAAVEFVTFRASIRADTEILLLMRSKGGASEAKRSRMYEAFQSYLSGYFERTIELAKELIQGEKL